MYMPMYMNMTCACVWTMHMCMVAPACLHSHLRTPDSRFHVRGYTPHGALSSCVQNVLVPARSLSAQRALLVVRMSLIVQSRARHPCTFTGLPGTYGMTMSRHGDSSRLARRAARRTTVVARAHPAYPPHLHPRPVATTTAAMCTNNTRTRGCGLPLACISSCLLLAVRSH
jgi:hypothetical protein